MYTSFIPKITNFFSVTSNKDSSSQSNISNITSNDSSTVEIDRSGHQFSAVDLSINEADTDENYLMMLRDHFTILPAKTSDGKIRRSYYDVKCKRCIFSGTTTISRLKSHVLKETKNGIAVCKSPDKVIVSRIQQLVGLKKQKTIDSSQPLISSSLPTEFAIEL